MTHKEIISRVKKVPSFLVGSYKQSKAAMEKPVNLKLEDKRETIIMVPGAFCTSSVMNPLAQKLSDMGFNVVLPPVFPYYLGPVANLCPLEQAARTFLKFVERFSKENNIQKYWIVGHSNGGLITLLALDIAEKEGNANFVKSVKGVITMATPYKGTDIAVLMQHIIPVCKDITPTASILDRIHAKKGFVKLAIQAGGDFLVPFDSQYLDGMKTLVMDGFQHMDFYVGGEPKVNLTANALKECINGN